MPMSMIHAHGIVMLTVSSNPVCSGVESICNLLTRNSAHVLLRSYQIYSIPIIENVCMESLNGEKCTFQLRTFIFLGQDSWSLKPRFNWFQIRIKQWLVLIVSMGCSSKQNGLDTASRKRRDLNNSVTDLESICVQVLEHWLGLPEILGDFYDGILLFMN